MTIKSFFTYAVIGALSLAAAGVLLLGGAAVYVSYHPEVLQFNYMPAGMP